ncbi:Arogenate dehydratase/prephenate dehydratase [Vigna angularis]|uniref:Arogenate dehydratase/prephenate dehydratase n=1 Tax=Phaseolus angularis TaxID=3914 RepID=A0A8T0L882_PHAAN|nr:Arogenate dehydratase/prephenate dehydratase [Vigna angularis]
MTRDGHKIISRYLVLARDPIIPKAYKPFKTSIVFTLNEGPGVLFKALAVFALRDINLSKDVCVKAPSGTNDATHFPLLPFLLILFSPTGMGTPFTTVSPACSFPTTVTFAAHHRSCTTPPPQNLQNATARPIAFEDAGYCKATSFVVIVALAALVAKPSHHRYSLAL